MNHDASHCLDMCAEYPSTCYRAMLTMELKLFGYSAPVSWAHFAGSQECPRRKSLMDENGKNYLIPKKIDRIKDANTEGE